MNDSTKGTSTRIQKLIAKNRISYMFYLSSTRAPQPTKKTYISRALSYRHNIDKINPCNITKFAFLTI